MDEKKVTLEKIDMVLDRIGCTYKEAKSALEKTDGDVLEAIILLEEEFEEDFDFVDNNEDSTEDSKTFFDNGIKTFKELLKKSNATRVVFYKGDKTILDIPIAVGAIGAIFFTNAAIVGAIACLAMDCSLKIFKENGDVLDIKDFSKESLNKIKDSFKDGDYKDSDEEDKK